MNHTGHVVAGTRETLTKFQRWISHFHQHQGEHDLLDAMGLIINGL